MMRLRARVCISLIFVLTITATALAQSPGRIEIAKTGESSLNSTINGTAVSVAFRSAQIPPGERISVRGRNVIVPRDVFADLLDPNDAALRVEHRLFVVRINGGDASEWYFVDVFFDARGVTRRRSYSTVVKTTLSSETRYFYHAF
jgi:hypothetical protein